MTTTTPQTVLPALTANDALRLMARVPFGRVVYTEGALPAIRPVQFTLDADTIVFRILVDEPLATTLHNTVVVFQADEYDPERVSGWTATATGRATRIDSPDEIAQLTAHMPQPWAKGGKLFRLRPEVIGGRRTAH